MQSSSKRKPRGASRKAAEATGAGSDRPRPLSIETPLEVELVHARRTHAGWALVGLALGFLLVWKLAIVGQVLGVICLVVAAFASKSFIFTLLHPPGTIELRDADVELPLGLCRGKSQTFDWQEVKHVFFLRRAVPWTRAGPVLVVEAGDLAFTYPRDWFASEAEQRRVLDAIQRKLERTA